MPTMLRLRQEQPGVVGVETMVWTLRERTLRRERLLNERVVEERAWVLSEADLRDLQEVLAQNQVQNLPASLGWHGERAEGQIGRIVLETEVSRCEMPYQLGSEPEPNARPEETRLRTIAEAIRSLEARAAHDL